MGFIAKYLLKYKKTLFFDFLMVFGFILAELGLPTLLAKIINVGIPKKDSTVVNQIIFWMIVFNFISVVMTIILNYLVAQISSSIMRDMRNDLFQHIQTFSHREYERIGISTLITRLTNDPFQIYLFITQILRMGLITPVMFTASIVMIMRTSPSLSIFVWLSLPIMVVFMWILTKITEPLSKRQQANLDGINEVFRENLSGFRVIRAFVREKFIGDRFGNVNLNYQKSTKHLFKLLAAADPGFTILFNIVSAMVLFSGALQIQSGVLELGDLIAFFDYIFHMLFSFMLLAMVLTMFPRANVSGKRIKEVLALSSSVKDLGEVSIPGGIEALTFKGVSFRYAEEEGNVLSGVSVSVQKGETLAVVGGTGSGKSTFIQLVSRVFDRTGGEILLNGIPIEEFRLNELRETIGMIPQKAQLYSGTIRENLLFGKSDADEEALLEGLKVADADRFVLEKESGLDSQITEGGTNFSGGQRQRLSIARAIVRNPSLFIFDDSFSALDAKTDRRVRQNLKVFAKHAITIIVAQRISTIMDATKILVLNDGEVEAIGTHDELLKISNTYRELAESQLTKEELY
ncbi:MAG: ABC transporter ATP-binding protein/permease [Streptococcaceae bacterium]|jgi:ATP-binding cassette subfamily B multidrug efflux pump|nr:ABC transporter ATP-binding protein/permease [Streptococcaceae bacterium]